MLRSDPLLSLLLLLVLVASPVAHAADDVFDLKVRLDLPPEVTARLQTGDLLQVIVRPEVQYGRRTVPGEPVVFEKAWEPGLVLEPIRLKGVLEPDQIYRLEFRIVRTDEKGDRHDVRYLSALAKLPRKPVENQVRIRLYLGHPKDPRDNHILVTRDSDGVFRVMLFTA